MTVKGNEKRPLSQCLSGLLVVVFLLLLSPVLVELVNFYSCIALLKQVKSLRMNKKTSINSIMTRVTKERKHTFLSIDSPGLITL